MHEFGFQIVVRDDGETLFLDPGGNLIPPAGVLKAASYDFAERFRRSPGANLPKWDGTPPDFPRAVDVLLQADGP